MKSCLKHLLVTPSEMARVDAATAKSGIPFGQLVERAGQAVAASALRHFPQARRYAVLCGPGNNGKDGYVAARALVQSGASVAVYGMADGQLGETLLRAEEYPISCAPLARYEPQDGDVIIDALFGGGLSRNVPAVVAEVINQVSKAALPVLAVDLPSGLCGRRGVPLGAAFKATRTIAFMNRKPGHLLLPGRSLCGDMEVVDIGIPTRTIRAAAAGWAENGPTLWGHLLPVPDEDAHKYRRGHLAVFSGPASRTGAARLSALAGLKRGAGLVTVASPPDAMSVNATSLTAIMLHQIETAQDLETWLDSAKLAAFVLGPGFGVGEKARQFSLRLKDRPLVLDADGITSFRDDPSELFKAFAAGDTHLVLTPHEGEFSRLFPDLADNAELSKLEKAVKAAERAHAAIVYKGADTVIAAPDGRAYINTNAPPWLATAGSGDVLAGMIGALLAQGMPAFEAAAAAVYLHGEAAKAAGRSMTAEDLAAHAGVEPGG
jgi:hydroxyethylthiazole kinase-like uncharacterized protein yjeF